MLGLAAEEGLIDNAPLVKLHKETNARDRALTEEEYELLLALSPVASSADYRLWIETGMRAGEIKRLTWGKIDCKTGFIRLAAEDTKTSEKRTIPLSPLLRETVEQIRKE
jgi:integrase